MSRLPYGLETNLSPEGRVEEVAAGRWRLCIPAGSGRRYRLAQVDNYERLGRGDFPHRPPLEIKLEAQASGSRLPGTWGFGLWNDPFGMGGLTGKRLRFPALPNTAWFFFASPENYLSLRDDLPGNGGLAATFRSPGWPAGLLAAGAPALGLVLLPGGRRLLRRLARRFVKQDAAVLKAGADRPAGAASLTDRPIDPTEWHEYRMRWDEGQATFWVDGERALRTEIAPRGRLGLVIWIDNQYAAMPPEGRFRYGMLANPEPAWIEVGGLEIEEG